MKWGTKYTAQDVNVLYSMVNRHLTLPYRFVCLTDDKSDIRTEVECYDMPNIYVPKCKAVSPWRKLGMFSPTIADLQGKTLFLDLDIVIFDELNSFFTYSEKFAIIENWTQKGQGIGNSSVYCFNIGAHTEVLNYYNNHPEEVTQLYSNEQVYLSKKIADIVYWPDTWCRSFKKHCMPALPLRYFQYPKKPNGVKILVFHGDPKPEDAARGGFFGNSIRKYVKAAQWISDSWCYTHRK